MSHRFWLRVDQAVIVGVFIVGVAQVPWHVAKALWRQR